jgi:hypothetical protein
MRDIVSRLLASTSAFLLLVCSSGCSVGQNSQSSLPAPGSGHDGAASGAVLAFGSSDGFSGAEPDAHGRHRLSIILNKPPWQDSGVTLKPNSTYLVLAHGPLDFFTGGCRGPRGCIVGPNGEVCKKVGFFAQGLRCWSLIGSIGSSGPAFQLGKHVTFNSGAGGKLYLGVNDNYYPDNTGHWTVTVCESDETLSREDIAAAHPCRR